jgi:hypothetical protein
VRRAKLYYLRGRTGKKARIAERRGHGHLCAISGCGRERSAGEAAPVSPEAEKADTVHWGDGGVRRARGNGPLHTGYWWAPDDSRIAIATGR